MAAPPLRPLGRRARRRGKAARARGQVGRAGRDGGVGQRVGAGALGEGGALGFRAAGSVAPAPDDVVGLIGRKVTAVANALLDENRPAFLDALELSEFTLGGAAPRIESIATHAETGGDFVQYRIRLGFHPPPDPGPRIVLTATVGRAGLRLPVPVLVSDLTFCIALIVRASGAAAGVPRRSPLDHRYFVYVAYDAGAVALCGGRLFTATAWTRGQPCPGPQWRDENAGDADAYAASQWAARRRDAAGEQGDGEHRVVPAAGTRVNPRGNWMCFEWTNPEGYSFLIRIVGGSPGQLSGGNPACMANADRTGCRWVSPWTALNQPIILQRMLDAAPAETHTSERLRAKAAVLGSLRTPEYVAGAAGSIDYLRWSRRALGAFSHDIVGQIAMAAPDYAADGVLEWLLGPEDVSTDVRAALERDTSWLLGRLFDESFKPADLEKRRRLYDLALECLRALPGFPRPADHGADVPHFFLAPDHLRPLLAEFGLAPSPATEKFYFSWLVERGDEIFEDEVPAMFLRALSLPSISDAERRTIAANCMPRIVLDHANSHVLRTVLDRGWCLPSPGAADLVLLFPNAEPGYPLLSHRDRREIFRSLAALLPRIPAHPAPLARAIELVAFVGEREGHLRGARGIVRLLLHHGCPASDPHVRMAVLGKTGAVGYTSWYTEDVLNARAWGRWIEKGCLGGLPPEVAGMVAHICWEEECLEGEDDD